MRRERANLFDLASELAEPPSAAGSLQPWIDGVAIAGLLVLYGAVCLLTRQAWFLNTTARGVAWLQAGLFRQYAGHAAMALGIVYASIGAFAHFHCFWSSRPVLGRYHELGKAASLVGLIAGLGWFLYAVLWAA